MCSRANWDISDIPDIPDILDIPDIPDIPDIVRVYAIFYGYISGGKCVRAECKILIEKGVSLFHCFTLIFKRTVSLFHSYFGNSCFTVSLFHGETVSLVSPVSPDYFFIKFEFFSVFFFNDFYIISIN